MALTRGAEDALGLFGRAIERLERVEARLELAHALIDQGSVLRRAGRPADAREPLARGVELAARCGTGGLVARADEELAATGMRRRRTRSDADELTPSERRVAAMAAEGLTNKQIAQTLFVSLETVETHLGSAYRKLGVWSRRELGSRL